MSKRKPDKSGKARPPREPHPRSRGKNTGPSDPGGGRNERAGSTGDPPSVLLPLLRTIRHFFPDLPTWLRSVSDRRDPRFITYPMAFELWTVFLLFWSKLSARRQVSLQFGTPACLHTLNFLAGCSLDRMMAPDTLPYGLARVPLEELVAIQQGLVYRLLRSKSLRFARLLNRYYLIAIDMTGLQTFSERHCDRCLSQEKDGRTVFYHAALEAKLVTPNGLALSVATEFVQNASPGDTRQDCELKAFPRLVRRLHRFFPQLRICLLLDGLYAVGPVLDLCKEFGWRHIITFKEGRAPAAFDEYERLRDGGGEVPSRQEPDASRSFCWVNGLPYGKHSVNVLECRETDGGGGAKRFVWMTDLAIREDTYLPIADEGGRQRWRIENEGFNMQKNGGYGLDHAYSEDEDVMRRFHSLLQSAHTILQLVEKGSLGSSLKRALGSLRNIARRLLEEIRLIGLDVPVFEGLGRIRIQVRLDTS